MVEPLKLLVSEEVYFSELLPKLSQAALRLWGKTQRDNQDIWLPLHVHLSDTVAVAEVLWEHWVPSIVKQVIARAIIKSGGATNETEASLQAKKLFLACAATHDIGKVTPAFQVKAEFSNPGVYYSVINNGLLFASMGNPEKVPHALASEAIAERRNWSRNIAIVLGGHHGKPPSESSLAADLDAFPNNTGFNDQSWLAVQDELFEYALQLIGMCPNDPIFQLKIEKTAQVILTGLLIMADWLASDQKNFPYLPLLVLPEMLESPGKRAITSWNELSWPQSLEVSNDYQGSCFFSQRFGFEPRPSQTAVIEELAAVQEPGLVIIEAPMGEGKTEAALAAAEIMAKKSGCGGLFVALPTQATSDGMFPRVERWIESLNDQSKHSIFLAHSKNLFNKNYRDLFQECSASVQVGIDSDVNEQRSTAVVNDWFFGNKRGILADFVVGTIDQLLMGGLKQKHLALRHLALANKVVIIDECHAYDAYMSSYLYLVMSWLGAYKVPTIVLSATLPNSKRKQLIDSYLLKDSTPKTTAVPGYNIAGSIAVPPKWADTTAYPLLTFTDNQSISQIEPEKSARKLQVKLQRFDENSLISKLEALLPDGGCVGIIANTVARAQQFFKLCVTRFGSDHVVLHHSQFIVPDRMQKESELREQLGPPVDNPNRPPLLIVVGTQVLEQSLDIDFDTLFTDICPMDLLIQRIGRMHRHTGRKRPSALQEARCYVMGILENGHYESNSEAIYSRHLLMNSDILLPDDLLLPDDISMLVQQAYSEKGLEDASAFPDEYRTEMQSYQDSIVQKQERASAFQISKPVGGAKTLVGWLDTSVDVGITGKLGEATVRDSGDSIEVLIIQQHSDGRFRLLPWLDQHGGAVIPKDGIPQIDIARTMARCSVKLPAFFCAPWRISHTIYELEQSNIDNLPHCWQDAACLEGELFLVLDDEYKTELGGQVMYYSREIGLSRERRIDERI